MTEHRVGTTVWGVVGFMSGEEALDSLLETLRAHDIEQNTASLLKEMG